MHCPVSDNTNPCGSLCADADFPAAHPNVHSTRIGPINEDKFDVVGLTFQCLQPYVKWRISYAGLLRNVDDNELRFVKFNFLYVMKWSKSLEPKTDH